MRFLRFCKIFFTILRFDLAELVLARVKHKRSKFFLRVLTLGRKLDQPSGVRLRLALESLGPVFIKFGQMLSTRRDLISPEITHELAKLQDQVPPFASELAVAMIEASLGQPIEVLFDEFGITPIASASVAQVHCARL